MINDNHTNIPEIPRAAAVWKNIRSSSKIPGVVSVAVVGKVVVFGKLGNEEELANMETGDLQTTETEGVNQDFFLHFLSRIRENRSKGAG